MEIFDKILKQDAWFFKKSEFRKTTGLTVHSDDTLWIVRTIIDDEISTRGYLRRDKFTLAVDMTHDTLGYRYDTAFDADFDGIDDYVIKYYSGVGCCPRDLNEVFIYRKQRKNFLPMIDLMNAFFDYDQKAILTMGYGFPGPSGIPNGITLSKEIWRGDSLVWIEGIGWEMDTTLSRVTDKSDKKEYLKDLPEDYKKIPMVEWFLLIRE